MARIESGNGPQSAGFAYLAGQDSGRRFGLAKKEEERRQLELAMEFQEALARTQMKREKLYQEELERKQKEREAQEMGMALDVQGQGLEARAGEFLPPEGFVGPPTIDDERLMTMLQAGEELKTPKARETYYAALESHLNDMQSAQERQAAEQAIRDNAKDGLIDENEFMARYQAGEEPVSLLKDISQRKEDQTIASIAMQDAEKATAQAQAIVDSLPPGRSQDAARIELTKWMNTPHLHEKPGAAQVMLAAVQRAALLEENEKQALRQAVIDRAQPGRDEKGNKTDFKWPETYGNRETPEPMSIPDWIPGWGGKALSSGKADQPRTPAMQGHIDKKKAEKAKRYPGSQDLPHGTAPQRLPEGQEGLAKGAEFAREVDELYRQSMSPAKVYAELEARGYDPDDTELAKIFSAVIQEANESASNLRVAGQ